MRPRRRRSLASFHPRLARRGPVSSNATSVGARDLLLPSAGCSDFWGNRGSRSGRFPLTNVDDRPGPRRVRFVPSPEAARGQSPDFRVLPRDHRDGVRPVCPPRPRNDRQQSSNPYVIPSSRAGPGRCILTEQTKWVDRVPSPRGSGPHRVCRPLAAGNNQMARGFTLSGIVRSRSPRPSPLPGPPSVVFCGGTICRPVTTTTA
jgi:hypothetical protein